MISVLIAMTHWSRAKLATTQLEKANVNVEKSERNSLDEDMVKS